MRSEQVANYVPLLQTGADLLDALAKTLKVEFEDIPYKAVEQFGLIFTIAVKRGILVHNPMDIYVNEYSRRATGRQQDVRNALVKKHFSLEEESAIFAAITENVTINKKELPKCVTKSLLLATVIRLFTGMAIREVAALRWADFVSIDGTELYQFTITKFVDSKGKIILHAERENWKAFIISTAFLAVFQICGESENILVSLVAVVLGIAWIVMQVKLLLRVAKAFGKGKGWAALLFFLPFVATLILGFGNAEYLGNFETPNVAEESAQIEG